jgi:tetratricopeptide (TPR) repeat protein
MYAGLGRLTDALPVLEEAVATYGELAQADPSRYRADLAQSLTDLGSTVSELGRLDQAEKIRTEADRLKEDS